MLVPTRVSYLGRGVKAAVTLGPSLTARTRGSFLPTTMNSSRNSRIAPSWCEWAEGCGKKATVQVVVFLKDTTKVELVWYACDYHGGGGLGPNTCRLEDVGREGDDFFLGSRGSPTAGH